MHNKHANALLATILPLFMAAAIGGCGHIEINKDSDAIASRMAASAPVTEPRCDTSYIMGAGGEEMPYSERLRRVLNLLTPQQLQTVEKHDVKLCLDQRQALTDRGINGGTFNNIFYPATKERGPVMAFYDDGREPRDFHITRQFAEKIAEGLERGTLPESPVFVERREVQCAPKWTCPVYDVRSVSFTGLARKHPEMMAPPVLRGR